jgi:hypothetical protein
VFGNFKQYIYDSYGTWIKLISISSAGQKDYSEYYIQFSYPSSIQEFQVQQFDVVASKIEAKEKYMYTWSPDLNVWLLWELMQVWPINIWPRLFYLLQLIYGYVLVVMESVRTGWRCEASWLAVLEFIHERKGNWLAPGCRRSEDYRPTKGKLNKSKYRCTYCLADAWPNKIRKERKYIILFEINTTFSGTSTMEETRIHTMYIMYVHIHGRSGVIFIYVR